MDDFGSSSMGHDDEASALPGFRFHPTDQELVGFYLRRKVEKKPMVIELIKQIDIYKYDPWDLPKSTVGDGEWYFFCRRGRKYKNSIRPNRVTGSGFWKATGIDKPVYSTGSADHDNCCIGLKKSLVYYRGNAGKGTKTDWMMHEFRLPMKDEPTILPKTSTSAYHQEAEVWTLCRILKRNSTYKKYNYSHRPAEDRPRIWAKQSPTEACSATGSVESDEGQGGYISFQAPMISFQDDGVKVPMVGRNQQFPSRNIANSNVVHAASVGPSLFLNDEIDNVGFPHDDVDELRSLVGQRTAVPTWSPFQLY